MSGGFNPSFTEGVKVFLTGVIILGFISGAGFAMCFPYLRNNLGDHFGLKLVKTELSAGLGTSVPLDGNSVFLKLTYWSASRAI